MMDARNTGIFGEMMAVRFLRKHGYTIVTTNFHSRFGEVDIIAQKKETLVFAEVKTRGESALITPAQAVTALKQQKIKKTALSYLALTRSQEMNVRFDVLEVVLKHRNKKSVCIRHIENAFD